MDGVSETLARRAKGLLKTYLELVGNKTRTILQLVLLSCTDWRFGGTVGGM